MASETIQAQYDTLENIAKRFDVEADNAEQMVKNLSRIVKQLEGGGWKGDAANAFYAEMSEAVFPALSRLQGAFSSANATTNSIVQVIQLAEYEAANQFNLSPSQMVIPKPKPVPTPQPPPISGGGGSIWDNFEFQGKGNIWTYDKNDGGAFDPAIGVVYGTKDLAVFGNPSEDGFTAIGGKGGVGVGVTTDDDGRIVTIAGAHGEFYVGQGKVDGVHGDDDLGLTGGFTGKVLSADGFAGYKDGSIGAQIGGSLISVEGEAGINVLGANVGLKGEIGLKAELGFSIGKDTEIKLPFVTIGFSFGGAKE